MMEWLEESEFREGSTPEEEQEEETVRNREMFAEPALGKSQQERDPLESHGMLHRQAHIGRERAAGIVVNAAEKLRERTARQGGLPGQVGPRVAGTIERSAEYVREHESAELFDDARQYVRGHPIQALGGAVFTGFLIGRILKRG